MLRGRNTRNHNNTTSDVVSCILSLSVSHQANVDLDRLTVDDSSSHTPGRTTSKE
jgi:hypothetical protein